MPAVVSARIVTPSLVVLLSSAITSVGACRSPACPARPLPVSARRRNGHVAMSTADAPPYRRDGVRIQHDPYAPGMAAKYGAPGKTDAEGFDPYADSVGAGIYSLGTVRRRETDGSVVVGAQYQNHNPRPGPVYSGGGYTPVSEAIAAFAREVDAGATPDRTTLAKLLDAHPDLVNDVATGGGSPSAHAACLAPTNARRRSSSNAEATSKPSTRTGTPHSIEWRVITWESAPRRCYARAPTRRRRRASFANARSRPSPSRPRRRRRPCSTRFARPGAFATIRVP